MYIPAYMLADAGYDVWMANLRGNAYTAHQTLKKTDAQFWDYRYVTSQYPQIY